MPRRPRVLLLIETSNAYARGLLRGVQRYAHERGNWSTYLPELRRGEAPPRWLAEWQGDGIIARIENAAIAKAVMQRKLPVVDVSAARELPTIPWVETDDEAIAVMAVEHLLERGFKHFAYCGDARFAWSQLRGQAFAQLASQHGIACHSFDLQRGLRASASYEREEKRLMDWIVQLPKPVGLFACYDIFGRQILEICRRLDIAAPEQVAVLGVDNDELLCGLTDPPLSSIEPDTLRTGYLAAELLDRMIQGQTVPAQAHLVKPLRLVTRQSTDILAIDDPEISRAARFIREHACDGIKVEDVLAKVSLSRRVLETRFRKILGRSPHEQIQLLQLRRVEQLLRETDLPLAMVADRAGFIHTEYMSVVVKQKLGVPPSEYRQQHRGKAT